MHIESISERDDLVIRRMILLPGEKTDWHADLCHRFSVVIHGTRLGIEYKDSGEITEFDLEAGDAGWDAPQPRIHRAINLGQERYEEVVTFYRSDPAVDPQPTFE